MKTAWRSLLRDRRFTVLNLAGLSTGLACAILIYMWVSFELSVDGFQKNKSRLYEVMQNVGLDNGSVMTIPNTPDLLAKAMADEMPEIETAVVIKSPDADDNAKGILSVNGNSLKAAERYVTPNFFDVFSCRLVQGNSKQVLSNTKDVLLSSDMAMKLFHTTENIVGRVVNWDRGTGDSGVFN